MIIINKRILTRLVLIIFLLAGINTITNAQNNPRRSSGEINKPDKEEEKDTTRNTQAAKFWDKVTFGGNVGASFGSATYVNISPMVGYKFTEDFTAGTGFTYIYLNDKYYNFSTNIYGPRVFAQYAVFSNLFAYTELDILNVDFYNSIEQRYDRTWVANPLVGGGYRAAIGPRSFMNFFILYNLNWAANKDLVSPYRNSPLIIRVGFSF
jgi:hypothetical protein